MGLLRSALPYRFRGLCEVVKTLFLYLILLVSLLYGYDVPWSIEEGLRHLKKVGDDEQIQALKGSEIIFKSEVLEFLAGKLDEQTRINFIKTLVNLEDTMVLEPAVMEALANRLGEEGRKSYIQNLLMEYSASERLSLLSALLVSTDYQTQLECLSPEKCREVGIRVNPIYFGNLPIIDWLNTQYLPSFFKPALKNALINRGHFNDYNSLDQVDVWIEPYGYHTFFNQTSDPLSFDLYTLGISIGGGYTMLERLIFSFGLCYSHTQVDWGGGMTASINTLYFGPTLSYFFPHGYVSTMFFGTINLYSIDRETCLFPKFMEKGREAHANHTSWNVANRSEGGLFVPLGKNFYLYPTITLDYVAVFEQSATETLDKNTTLLVQPLHESFFKTKVSFKVTREIFEFVVPYLSVGWQKLIPLSQSSYYYKLEGCDETFSEKTTPDFWSQYCIGAGLSFLHIRGIFGSLSYEFCTGYGCPTHIGDIRIGFTW